MPDPDVRLDVHRVVNNAGFGGGTAFEDTTEEFFDELMRVLLKGPYFLTQTLLPPLADGSAIVNTSSRSALDIGVEADSGSATG